MSQRIVMRMSIAQMEAIDRRKQAGVSECGTGPHIIERPDTFYTVTQHNTSTQGLFYAVIFGPTKSLDEALAALAHLYPKTMVWISEIHGLEWDPNNHFTWTEVNGGKVLIRIEQETNPTIFATSKDQEMFTLVSRVTNFDDKPASEEARLKGTFLTQPESTAAALRLFRAYIDGRDVDKLESVKEDGLIFCKAQSRGDGGYRWTVEAFKSPWGGLRIW